MAKPKLYQVAEGYNLTIHKQKEIFINSDSLGMRFTYKDAFQQSIRLAKKDKRLVFTVIFNEDTQIILKRKHLIK